MSFSRFGRMTANGFGLGEVERQPCALEKLRQTRVISWLDCLAQMPNRSTKEKIKIKKAWEKIYYIMVIA